ncbi:MAG: hypothetical protein A4E52_00460 [Pelotomaculum sp. PtaB.Bin013]|uniref:Uncharacterized protein n=1 Tax=Pelotomaculum isophthalicicum JI TaxID=947010 RepID=A0A9X4H2I0_9FIRM|nr:hypothetical protein [Pelotomaculum isophthalicicum]MDF9408386.1 hypothetical protein [Pelotomaculum isophthalicicum JI]OPX91564.1 MAG: hypothetical protein A4E52_00460 [Pelotomaculum sp. PtaB.Bin013]
MKRVFIAITILLTIIYLAGCSTEKTAGQSTVKGKTIEEALNKSNRNISSILHKEELPNGALVFYVPGFTDNEAKSKLGLEYLKRTPNGWEMSYQGGMYSTNVEQAIYFEFFPDDKDEGTPLPLIYGEIKDRNITQVLVNDLKYQTQQQAKIINVDREPGLQSDIRVWYAASEIQGSKFEIIGKGDAGEILFLQKVNALVGCETSNES